MHRSVAVLSLLVAFSTTATALSDASPEQAFSLGNLTVRAPKDGGWKIVRESPRGVVLSGNTEHVARLASAHLFSFPPPYDRSSFLAEVQRNVESQFARPGITLSSTSYVYGETRGYPCVAVRTLADIREQPAWPKGHEERIHYRMLFCKVPEASELGVLASFSYTGSSPSAGRDVEAEEFINTLSLSRSK